MTEDSVLVTVRDRVMILTINRPAVRNALDGPTLAALSTHLEDADQSRDIRAVVIAGAGHRAFSAGLDLTAVARAGLPDPERSPATLLRRGSIGTPVIAAVSGAAVGGGFELALACDLRVAADHAFFALPEVGLGLAATEGGTDLPIHLPMAVALEIGLTGNRISATRAYELGLVNRVVTGTEVMATALELADAIARQSPLAVRTTKRLMHHAATADVSARMRAGAEATRELLAGPDAHEGPTAFTERRAPRWSDDS